jgi:SPP1 family predicted phage head-tail adaptor
MRAGALDRRLTIRRATVTQDEFNADVVVWENLTTVWASKTDIRDAERVQAQQVGASVTTRFQIRWSLEVSDISAEDQLECDGRIYAIVGVPKELGRRSGLEITATAQANVP